MIQIVIKQSDQQIQFTNLNYVLQYINWFEIHKLNKLVLIGTVKRAAIEISIRTVIITIYSKVNINMELQLYNILYTSSISSNLFSIKLAYNKVFKI